MTTEQKVLRGLGGMFLFLLAFIGYRVYAEVNFDPVNDTDFFIQVFKFVTTVKGLAISAIAVGVTQLLMIFFRTQLAGFAGKWRLPVVAGLTVFSLILGSLASGMPLLGAIAQGPVLCALQVFIHQIYVQFFGGGSNS